jgi:hypothetical protein
MRTSCSDALIVLDLIILIVVHGEEYSHNASYYVILSGHELFPPIKKPSVIPHSNAHKLGCSKADTRRVRFVKETNFIIGIVLCVYREKI